MIDPAEALVFRSFERTQDQPFAHLSRAQLIALALVILLAHGMLASYLARLSQPRSLTGSQALELIWLVESRPDEAPVPPMPQPPIRPRAAPTSIAAPVAASEEAVGRLAAPTIDRAESVSRPQVPLLRTDGSLRLPEVELKFQRWTDADRIRYDREVRLPGLSDSAAADLVAVRMREAMSPEKVVNAVLRFLFGKPVKDDCRTIGDRLQASDPGVVREIDLFKFRKQCAS